MKKVFLLLILIFNVSIYLNGQTMLDEKVLVLASKKYGTTIHIKEQSRIKVGFKDAFFNDVSSRMTILNDSTIRIKSMVIPISSIASVSTKSKVGKTFGGIVVGAGIVGIIVGSVAYYNANQPSSVPGGDAFDELQRSIATGYMVAGTAVIGLGSLIINHKVKYSLEQYDIAIISQ